MKKTVILGLALISLLILACQKPVEQPKNQSIFNQTLNQEIEDLTNVTGTLNDTSFNEFTINYTTRSEAKYEIARDDIFELSNGSFNSTEISILGLMLGDNYTKVLATLGVPDVMFVPADKAYRNMEYSKKIGIGNKMTAVTYHLENDTVTMINMRNSFKKYTVGNTSFGQTKDYIYAKLGLPDYQDFTSYYKVFHYTEKGIDLYLRRDYIDVISLIEPREFKGVKYITVIEEIAPGIFVNSTKAVLTD